MKETVESKLKILQSQLAHVDISKKSRSGLELIVLRRQQITLRIQPDKNHARPHIHLDYGNEFHAASICIKSSDILAGNIPTKYRRVLQAWMSENRNALLKIWDDLKGGGDGTNFVIELSN